LTNKLNCVILPNYTQFAARNHKNNRKDNHLITLEAAPTNETQLQVLTWKDVLQRDDIVGGDLRYLFGSTMYRGPIKSISGPTHILIEFEWLAIYDGNGQWVTSCVDRLLFSGRLYPPRDIGQGCVSFQMLIGSCTIFPKGGEKLNPADVAGLKMP